MSLACALEKFHHLRSYWTKGILVVPGVDLRVQIVEWDKLLEFIVQTLVLPELGLDTDDTEHETSLGRTIHAINARNFALPTEHNDKAIRWAHRQRNSVVHDIHFDFYNEKQRENVIRAIEILESTCKHILECYELENNWAVVE